MKNIQSSQTRCPICAVLLVSLLAATIVSAQPRPWMPPADVTLSARGTGRTTGHIIMLLAVNTSPKPQQFAVPPFTIPSDGKHQGFIVPDPTPVTVPGNGTITVPVSGYCTHPDLPAPPSGTTLPTPSALPDDAPLLTTIRQIRKVIPTLQQNGQITTPFSNNRDRERESVIQQFTWYYSHPSVFDPCLHIQNTMTTPVRDTDWYPAFSSTIEQGIGQIADAMLQVGRISSLPDFRPPAPPITAPTPAQPPSNPLVASTVRVTGTGNTTGHIADISVSNPTKEPITVRIGDGAAAFIPPTGQYQPYVVPSLPVIPVPPGATVTVPIEGFCVDVRRPPVGLGDVMPPIRDWISGGPTVPEPMNPPGGTVVSLPTQTAPPLSTVVGILQNLPPPPALSKWDCPDLPATNRALIPGTDRPVATPINTDQMPALGVPLLLDAINRITRAYDELKPKGSIATPFSGNPDKEREAVIQQTFWMYSAALRGEPYRKDDFRDNTIKQFEQNTGRSFPQIPQPQQEQIDKGVDDFWNSFQATGVEAKILPKVPMEPRPEPKLDDLWNSFNDGGGKLKGTTTAPMPTDPRQMTAEPVEPPVLIQNRPRRERPREKKCECGSVSFDLQIWTWGKDGTGKDAGKGGPHKEAVSGSTTPGQAAQTVPIKKANLPDRPAQADKYLIAIRDIQADCPCTEWTEAIEQAVKALAKAESDNSNKISKAKKALNEAQKELSDVEGKLAEAKAAKRPSQTTIARLEKEVRKAKGEKDKAESDLAALENPIKAQKTELDNLKKAAKQSDCPVYSDATKTLSKLPKVVVKEANAVKIEKKPDGSALEPEKHYYSFMHDPAKPLTYEITISFYCEGADCKPVACSRTFLVKVEE